MSHQQHKTHDHILHGCWYCEHPVIPLTRRHAEGTKVFTPADGNRKRTRELMNHKDWKYIQRARQKEWHEMWIRKNPKEKV
jgi:hypothetical protein